MMILNLDFPGIFMYSVVILADGQMKSLEFIFKIGHVFFVEFVTGFCIERRESDGDDSMRLSLCLARLCLFVASLDFLRAIRAKKTKRNVGEEEEKGRKLREFADTSN